MKATELSDTFYRLPDIASATMTRKDLRELMLDTGGQIITCGRRRVIMPKHLGAGVYLVTLAPQLE